MPTVSGPRPVATMALRKAGETLTGFIPPRRANGRRRAQFEPDLRYGMHENGNPAVTVDLKGRYGTRTFDSYMDLCDLAAELWEAAEWLAAAQAADNDPGSGDRGDLLRLRP